VSNINSIGLTNPMVAMVVVVTALIATLAGATTLEDVRKKGSSNAGWALTCSDFHASMRTASGRGWTSTCAGPWPPPCLETRKRWNTPL